MIRRKVRKIRESSPLSCVSISRLERRKKKSLQALLRRLLKLLKESFGLIGACEAIVGLPFNWKVSEIARCSSINHKQMIFRFLRIFNGLNAFVGEDHLKWFIKMIQFMNFIMWNRTIEKLETERGNALGRVSQTLALKFDVSALAQQISFESKTFDEKCWSARNWRAPWSFFHDLCKLRGLKPENFNVSN